MNYSQRIKAILQRGYRYPFCILVLTSLLSCQTPYVSLEPTIQYATSPRLISSLPSPFEKLTTEELNTPWGKELYIGLCFARELDLYRAITALKRALILLPASQSSRQLQIQYSLFECYYLGQKYSEALEIFDHSQLITLAETFKGFKDLMMMLFDCYHQTNQPEKAEKVYQLIDQYDADIGQNLLISTAFQEANLEAIRTLSANHSNQAQLEHFVDFYQAHKKSVSIARLLNGLLPGVGYYYVGQKKTATVSFVINALFLGATYLFIKNGNYPAGIITASLESGWYIGGINGAGLAAKEYNERLYEVNAKETMIQNRLFPILMFGTSF